MPCLLNSPDSSNLSFHFRQTGYVPQCRHGREKRLWGGRPRSEGNRPSTFFLALSRRHTPLPRCLSFHSLMQLSGSYKKRCPRAFPMSGPTAVNRPRHGKGTRAYSRLTEVNPYSAPVIRGHMCLACQKSRFSSCSPFASGEQSEKKRLQIPLGSLLSLWHLSCLHHDKQIPLGSLINSRTKCGDMR